MGEVIRKTKNGRFLGYYLRWREKGRRVCIASKQPTAAEARKMLVQIEARVARGLLGLEAPKEKDDALTVAALCKRFLEEFESPRIKDINRYRRTAHYALVRILPYVGKIPLVALRRQDIERARDKLSRCYRKNTVRSSLRPLSTALSWAVRQDLLLVNPSRGMELPRREQSTEHLSTTEATRLLAEAERKAREASHPQWWCRWIAVSLALRLGLRRGEIFGLRWTDVDFDTGRLTVARSYHLLPKSNKPRVLPLPSSLAPLLREWRALCPKNKEQLVCPLRHKGSWHMSSPRASHGLKKLLQSAGCPPLSRGFHALRHSFSTAFVEKGGSLLTLREILGHASLEMSLVYSHVSAGALVGDLEKLRY